MIDDVLQKIFRTPAGAKPWALSLLKAMQSLGHVKTPWMRYCYRLLLRPSNSHLPNPNPTQSSRSCSFAKVVKALSDEIDFVSDPSPPTLEQPSQHPQQAGHETQSQYSGVAVPVHARADEGIVFSPIVKDRAVSCPGQCQRCHQHEHHD